MKARCFYSKDKKFKYYGGRGITVCDKWMDFLNFRNDMYDSYLEHKAKHTSTTIERKDNDGNYRKNNCCWITREEQPLNRQEPQYKRIIPMEDQQAQALYKYAKRTGLMIPEIIRRAVDEFLAHVGSRQHFKT